MRSKLLRHASRWRRATLGLERLETRVVPATITVTSTADDPTMVLDSLHAAIDSINNGADTNPAIAAERTGTYGQNDTVAFDIPGSGVQTINLANPLPAIVVPMTIDGYTQPGAQANTQASGGTNAHLLIELRGPGSSTSAPNGLTIAAHDVTVRGLVINNFGETAGLLLFGKNAHGDVIAGNFIGTDATGLSAGLSDATGVLVSDGASGNTIGGAQPADRNLIAGNGVGVDFEKAGTSGNRVEGNLIGTNASADAALSNETAGVQIGQGATSNTVGGALNGTSNIIFLADTYSTGVAVEGIGTDGNIISGNTIGTPSRGTAMFNSSTGVAIFGGPNGTIVGGNTPEARNRIYNVNNGVLIQGSESQHNVVSGNWIGLDASGTNAQGTGVGVTIQDAPNNTIGGTAPGAGNVISGNNVGIAIQSAGSTGNLVAGNRIGTDASGQAPLPNGIGVELYQGAHNNTIGGTAPADRNVISGGQYGVDIKGVGTTRNVVAGNAIGTDASGSLLLSSTLSGVNLSDGASSNTIGGTALGASNLILIADNTFGVQIVSPGTDHNVVAGNTIGTPTRSTAMFNSSTGVAIFDGPTGTVVGGTTAGARNRIYNVNNGVLIQGYPTRQNVVLGNWIGLNANGTGAQGTGVGVTIQDAPNNTIGGTAPGAGNVISGNNVGIAIQSAGSTGNLVAGNRIGTDASGQAPLPNGIGVELYQGAHNNTIGGTSRAYGNTIADNIKGVVVGSSPSDTGTVDNAVLGDSIVNNRTMGIDLGNDGPNPNGVNPRSFPNHGQNTPVITSVVGTTVTGTLDSAPNTYYRIDFFVGAASGPAQGTYLSRAALVKTDSHGHATFTADTLKPIPSGAGLTATATNLTTRDTSEFSTAVKPTIAIEPAALPPLTVGRPFRVVESVAGDGGHTFTFAVTAGVLPAGLTLNAKTGLIQGTPTARGPYAFTLAAVASDGVRVGRRYLGVVEAAASPAPRVLNVGIRNRGTTIVLAFNTALDPARAQNLANYDLFAVAAKAKGGGLRPVALASAVYDPSHRRVTLTPASTRLFPRQSYVLKVHGAPPLGLASSSGVPLDGLGNGHPGTDYAHVLGPHALTASATAGLGSGRSLNS